jgi:hypothetical protein
MKNDKYEIVKICKKFLISYFSDGEKKTISDIEKEITGNAKLENTPFNAALKGLVYEAKIIEFLDNTNKLHYYQQVRAKKAMDKIAAQNTPDMINKKIEREERKKWLATRRIDMAIERLNGATLKEIAEKYSRSQDVVRQQVSKAFLIIRRVYADKISDSLYYKKEDPRLSKFLLMYKETIKEQNEN